MSDKTLLNIVGFARPEFRPVPSNEPLSSNEPVHGVKRYRGVNLYVKNLNDRVDDDFLFDLFSPYGKILSSKVIYSSDQRPKGYGFVNFSTAEEAKRAIENLNGHIVFSQILHVSVARQKKSYRKTHYPAENPQRMHFQYSDDDDTHSQYEWSTDDMEVNFKRGNEEDHSDKPHEQSMDSLQDSTGLSSRIASLLNNKTFSDVQFCVGTEMFYAHKLVLSLLSEDFASMFYGEHALGELKPIVVSDVTSRGFSNMLQHMYTEDLEFDDVQDAKETLEAAQKFCVPDLLTKCRDYLFGSCEITANNVCFIFENAELSGISDVVNKCQNIFQTETKDVLKSSHFLSSDLTTVEAILKNECLNINSELDLIEAVVAWGKEECRRHDVSPEATNVKTCVGPLLKHLRFLSLPTEVFFKVVKETDLLSAAEACAITFKISQPDLATSFPPGICQKTNARVPPSSKLSFCYFKFPLVETEQMFSTGFKADIISKISITVEEGQIRICGFILRIKKLRFQVDVLDIDVDIQSSVDRCSFQEKIEVSDEPVNVMLKKAFHIPRKESAVLRIAIEDLQVNRCYSCTRSDISIEKADVKLKVHLSGNRRNENGSILFPVNLLLYEKCQL